LYSYQVNIDKLRLCSEIVAKGIGLLYYIRENALFNCPIWVIDMNYEMNKIIVLIIL